MGTFTPVPSSGADLSGPTLSSLISEVRCIAAIKAADETRTSSTYSADADLHVSIPAAGSYEVKCVLLYNGPTGGTNGRLKVRFNFPTGAISIGHVGGKNNTAVADANMTDIDIGAVINATSSPTADFLVPTVNTTVDLTVIFEGTLVATAAGTLSIDTAQISTSGTTTIRAHSRLHALQLL